MDAINEAGMPPDAPAPAVAPLTLRQLRQAFRTYLEFQAYLLRTGTDKETLGRILACLAKVTAFLEKDARRHFAGHGRRRRGRRRRRSWRWTRANRPCRAPGRAGGNASRRSVSPSRSR